MEQLLNDVAIALQELKKDEILRYVDQDYGQLNITPPSVDFPCALIDVSEANFIDNGLLTQTAQVSIQIRIADVSYDSLGESLDLGKKITFLGLYSKINSILHGKSWGCYARLIRQNIKKQDRPDGVREWILEYKTSFKE